LSPTRTTRAARHDPWRILLVDDHPLVREALAARIGQQPDLVVCGEADDVASGTRSVIELKPDLVTVDLTLKSGSGLDLIRAIRGYRHDTRVLVVSMHADTADVERALQVGAEGYVSKAEAPARVVEGIRALLGSETYLSPQIRERLARAGAERGAPPPRVELLTARERDVFRLMGRGLSAREIATSLGISTKTVSTHRDALKRKLAVRTLTELARQAVLWIAARP